MLSLGGDSVNLMLNSNARVQYFKSRCNYFSRTGYMESQCTTRQADISATGTTSNNPNGRIVAPLRGFRNPKHQTNPPASKPLGSRNPKKKPPNQCGNSSVNNVTANNVTTDEPVI